MGNWHRKWKNRGDYPWHTQFYISQKTVDDSKWYCVRYRIDKSEASPVWWKWKGPAVRWIDRNWEQAIEKKMEEMLLG